MEISNNFFSALESLPISFLLFEHFVFVSSLFFLDEIKSLFDHIIKILGLFINGPSIFNLVRLKLKHIFFHHDIDLSIPIHLCLHLLDLEGNRSLEIVL